VLGTKKPKKPQIGKGHKAKIPTKALWAKASPWAFFSTCKKY